MPPPSEDDLQAITERLVVKARYDRTTRVLEVCTSGGAIRYEHVIALGATQGARMAALDWVSDTLPQTIFSERTGGVERAAAPLGVTWLLGDATDYERSPVRDALGFTGGRWFRLFVAARGVEAVRAPT